MKFLLKPIFFSCFLLIILSSNAKSVFKTIYINRGVFTTVSGSTFPYLAFNETNKFNAHNLIIQINKGDSIKFKIYNTDTAAHEFLIDVVSFVNFTIKPGDSAIASAGFDKIGTFIFYDSKQYPKFRYLGLGGMICVENSKNSKNYYWNIKEHQTQFNTDLIKNIAVNWTQYEPDYFTINGLSHPDLQNDTTAVIDVKVGDTVHIFIANTGNSIHSLHFHGFHLKVVFSNNKWPIKLHWNKVTFSAKSMETYLLEMVPDKPGKYAVHDHNSVALTGGNKHPNGMILIMNVK